MADTVQDDGQIKIASPTDAVVRQIFDILKLLPTVDVASPGIWFDPSTGTLKVGTV